MYQQGECNNIESMAVSLLKLTYHSNNSIKERLWHAYRQCNATESMLFAVEGIRMRDGAVRGSGDMQISYLIIIDEIIIKQNKTPPTNHQKVQ